MLGNMDLQGVLNLGRLLVMLHGNFVTVFEKINFKEQLNHSSTNKLQNEVPMQHSKESSQWWHTPENPNTRVKKKTPE